MSHKIRLLPAKLLAGSWRLTMH